MSRIETVILTNLVHNETYLRKVVPFLKPEYFTGAEKSMLVEIQKFVEQYNAPPSVEALSVITQVNPSFTEQEFKDIVELLSDIADAKPANPDWLNDATEKFCKDKAIYNAIVRSISIIDGKDKELTADSLPSLLTDALSVSFDTAIGHDYLNDAETRFDYYNHKEARIPFDLDMLNKITKGGVPRKTLNVLIAGVNVGKSLALCHLASSYLSQGKKVLYITMEMSQEETAKRIDANLMNTSIDDLPDLSKDMFVSRFNKVREKTEGRLIIKEYPTASAHVGHFRALMQELAIKQEFVPDVVIIDYLNICASARYKLSGSVNTYVYIKGIAEELRGFAVEFNVPLWTATQLTRTGFSSSDVDMDDTAESFGLPATADFMLALISTEDLEKLGQFMVKQLKNRYGDKNILRRFVIGVDKAKMRLYDVDESAQRNIMQEAVSPAPFERDDRPQMGGLLRGQHTRGAYNFSDLKV
jgi:archaellum biogenesis ATPase FlaH